MKAFVRFGGGDGGDGGDGGGWIVSILINYFSYLDLNIPIQILCSKLHLSLYT